MPLSLPSWQNLGRLVLALSLDVAWLLATVADALLGLSRWALSGDVTCLATVVALLTTALGAVLAVVTIATARLEAVSYVSWRVRINLRSRSGHHLVLLQHHTLRRVHHRSLRHVRRRRSYRHQPAGTNERYDQPGHLCIVSNNLLSTSVILTFVALLSTTASSTAVASAAVAAPVTTAATAALLVAGLVAVTG